MLGNMKERIEQIRSNTWYANEGQRMIRKGAELLLLVFRAVIIVGLSYVILGPLIGIIANSLFSNSDAYSPIVYIIPQNPTLERYRLAILRMDYWNTLRNTLIYVVSLTVIQVFVCSLVGYGFARYNFPFKKVLFAFVIIMIVVPPHSIMFPLYITFRNFNPLWLAGLFTADGRGLSLLQTPYPMYIMSVLATGLRAGLYIFIFNQFFRALPKEIEEASAIDGAGAIYTYFRIMLPNAVPAIITVTIFSIVWQYNDTFYARLFLTNDNIILSRKIQSLQYNIQNLDRVMDPSISQLYVYAGVVLLIIPVVILYVLLQKQFIEGVERSGIVG
ncbi:MAG: carbohydrate ABC transporter permease [Oscillospiraceae bacterium]|nr:carbohydrate ABC transporter permease [Oscillospiraceae bacterium]